jgi:hypothetical protein
LICRLLPEAVRCHRNGGRVPIGAFATGTVTVLTATPFRRQPPAFPEAIRRQATMPSMTQQSHPRHDTTDQHEQVLLGVDTHKDVHVAAVITSTGLLLDTRSFPTE